MTLLGLVRVGEISRNDWKQATGPHSLLNHYSLSTTRGKCEHDGND